MYGIEHYDRLSLMKKVVLFIFMLVIALSTIFMIANLSWLGSVYSVFETVNPDNFKTTGIDMDQNDGKFIYTSNFSHEGITNIQTSRIDVNITIVSDGDLRQINPSVRLNKTQFGEYTVNMTGFLSTESVEKVDEGSVQITSPRKLDKISICIIYLDTPVICSGNKDVTESAEDS